MRRALVVFAERLPELSMLGAWFALPGVIATLFAATASAFVPRPLQPLVWIVSLMLPMFIATPLAMASISSIFGDLRARPFVRVAWRHVARTVIAAGSAAASDDGRAREDDQRDGISLYGAWVHVAVRRYIATSRATKGSGIKNMIAFVDLFRRQGERSRPARLASMAEVLPTRAFATMAVAQFAVLLLFPALAVLAMYGLLSAFSVPAANASVLLAAVGGLAFSAALFLQVFIALVDVMLYDLAFAMTEA